MKQGARRACVDPELEGLRRELEAWRRGRRAGSRIPERIWEQAAVLAREHGVSRVAAALRLEYSSLKERVESEEDGLETPAFVELAPTGPGSGSGVVVEVERPDGARMTIRMDGSGDVVGLAEVFLEAGA